MRVGPGRLLRASARCLLAALLLASTPSACASGEPERERALSFGGGGCGKLEGGVAVPCSGPNYAFYSRLACALGRNYLHPLVAESLVEAYAQLAQTLPGRTFQLGELGREHGGRLWPHKTHQSGVSADFFVPVVDREQRPARVPISPLDKLGYGLEFSRAGRLDDLQVDFAALGAHLRALAQAGSRRGVSIARVIVTPDYHAALFRADPALGALRSRFMQREAWVRHDEHYHVDFALPARYQRPLRCKAKSPSRAL